MNTLRGIVLSKTMWLNALAMLLAFLLNHQQVWAVHVDADTQVMVLAVLNWAVRLVTAESLADKGAFR